jgi:hypothetical protein
VFKLPNSWQAPADTNHLFVGFGVFKKTETPKSETPKTHVRRHCNAVISSCICDGFWGVSLDSVGVAVWQVIGYRLEAETRRSNEETCNRGCLSASDRIGEAVAVVTVEQS